MGVSTERSEAGGLLASRLRIAVTRLARRLRQQVDAPITPSQLSALAAIERLGPVTLGALAAYERVRPPSMTRIAATLEEDGLAERENDPADRRVSRVRITPAGRRLIARTRSRKTLYLAARLESLSPEDRALLERSVDLLERLVEDAP